MQKTPQSDNVSLQTEKGTWISGQKMLELNGPGAQIWQLSKNLGQGRIETRCLDHGLALTISDFCLDCPLNASMQEAQDRIHIAFPIFGSSFNYTASPNTGFECKPHYNCLYWSSGRRLHRQAESGQRLKTVLVSLPKEFLAGLDDNSLDFNAPNLISEQPNTPMMQAILDQILNCQLTGGPRHLFLQSKAMELISLKWAAMSSRQTSISERQQAGVTKVQERLLKDLANPPSTQELARLSGMSHPLLNRCFRQVTGFTVFDYLRNKRLEVAYDLVINNAASLTEIAFATGFSSSSHFSRAFAAHFGQPPSRLRETFANGQING